jgi:hypothetical protein
MAKRKQEIKVEFRTEQSSKNIKRSKHERLPNSYILILCEGEKPEVAYFKGLCYFLKLDRNRIKIQQAKSGNSPMQIVNEALALHKDDTFDRIFCVFDKDTHTTYQSAMKKIKDLQDSKKSIPIVAINSVPCFEFWLLLHFENTSREYVQNGANRVKDQLERNLKNHLPEYDSSLENIFALTERSLEQALVRAKLLNQQQEKAGTDNPSTKVYELVEFLQKFRKSNN